MTDSTSFSVGAWSYGLALAGYIVFGVRTAVGSRRSARARLLLLALGATAAWAALSLPLVLVSTTTTRVLASIGDSARYAAWLLFLWHLFVRPENGPAVALPGSRNAFIGLCAVLVTNVFLTPGIADSETSAVLGPRTGYLVQVCLAVLALVLVEQFVRRVHPQMRWSIKPLAVALGGLFGLDLFMYADAILFGQLDPDIWVARGFASVMIIPFLAIATVRNTGWTVDLHVSRGAVFQSTALLLSGAFLLLVAGAGYYVRIFGGSWGRALQIELLFAGALAVMLVAYSGRFRAKLRVFISKHFFSYRYDYRELWLRFTRTLSVDNAIQSVQERTIMALADLVESPGGALWLDDGRSGYVAAARWNMTHVTSFEPVGGPLPSFLKRTGWVVDIPELRAQPARYDGLSLPPWLETLPSPWLVVPLASGSELIGFVVLMAPRAANSIDWEVRDVLKTASRQAASYLGHVKATEALLEARKFDAFNRMSAFVVHDLKNLVAQLSLMLKNAERHRNNPEFQVDMLQTVQHVVGRMNALMLQLRSGVDPVENARHVDIAAVVRRTVAAKHGMGARIDLDRTPPTFAFGHEDRLEHVVGHLVQNALDASPPGAAIQVTVESDERSVAVVVSDNGAGMTAEFIRDRLFKPFETTKPAGMGIGLYESAQYVRGIGGDIEVYSTPGDGTRVRMVMPRNEARAAHAALHEQVI